MLTARTLVPAGAGNAVGEVPDYEPDIWASCTRRRTRCSATNSRRQSDGGRRDGWVSAQTPPQALCVYYMCMARVNVYLPDDLVEEVRAAGLNVSNVSQQALRRELAGRRSTDWLDRLETLPRLAVSHEDALNAVEAARSELGT